MVRPSLRTRSVGARLTAAEYASLERQAEASGQSLSEWCREVMLASVNGQAPKNRQSVGTEVQAVMAERNLGTCCASWRSSRISRFPPFNPVTKLTPSRIGPSRGR